MTDNDPIASSSSSSPGEERDELLRCDEDPDEPPSPLMLPAKALQPDPAPSVLSRMDAQSDAIDDLERDFQYEKDHRKTREREMHEYLSSLEQQLRDLKHEVVGKDGTASIDTLTLGEEVANHRLHIEQLREENRELRAELHDLKRKMEQHQEAPSPKRRKRN